MTESFVIAANGAFSDGPAQALRDHLVARGARVTTIFHPLDAHEGGRHFVATFDGGVRTAERTVRLPLRPPLSYAVDPFVPLVAPRADAWFGFNPLTCARGLVARRLGRTRRVVLWSVDFTPDRFGSGATTRLYDRLDKFCCLHADARVELSTTARDARDRRHGIAGDAVPTQVVPMGTWLGRVQTTKSDAFARRRVVYLGNLVRGKGVELLLDALAGMDVPADIVGGGWLEQHVRDRVAELGLAGRVRVHGFVPDHRDVERILSEAAIAVAPYAPEEKSYTRWADPGKLKAYLAAGLPVVMTDVPPNAAELACEAGVELVSYDARELTAAITRGLASEQSWHERRAAARAYAARFDWNILLSDALGRLGFSDAPSR